MISKKDQTVWPPGIVLVREHSHYGAFHPGFSHKLFNCILGRKKFPLVTEFGENREAVEVSEPVEVDGCHLSGAFVFSVRLDRALATEAFASHLSDIGRRDRIRIFAQGPNQVFRVLQVTLYG